MHVNYFLVSDSSFCGLLYFALDIVLAWVDYILLGIVEEILLMELVFTWIHFFCKTKILLVVQIIINLLIRSNVFLDFVYVKTFLSKHPCQIKWLSFKLDIRLFKTKFFLNKFLRVFGYLNVTYHVAL